MASKKNSAPAPLSADVQAIVDDLIRAVKRAPDLRALDRALRVMPGAGVAGEAAARLVNSALIPTFGGKRPNDEAAFSWSREEMLCAGDEGMFAAVILPRPTEEPAKPVERKAKDLVVPVSPAPEPAEDGATTSPTDTSPGHDPVEAATAIRAALERQGLEVKDVWVKPRPAGAQAVLKLVVSGRAHNQAVDLPADVWALSLRELASGLAESFVGGA